MLVHAVSIEFSVLSLGAVCGGGRSRGGEVSILCFGGNVITFTSFYLFLLNVMASSAFCVFFTLSFCHFYAVIKTF